MTFIFQNSFDTCSMPGKIRKKMQNDRNSLQDSKNFEFSRHPPTGNVPPELKLLNFPAFFNPRLRKNWTVKFKIIFFSAVRYFLQSIDFFSKFFVRSNSSYLASEILRNVLFSSQKFSTSS